MPLPQFTTCGGISMHRKTNNLRVECRKHRRLLPCLLRLRPLPLRYGETLRHPFFSNAKCPIHNGGNNDSWQQCRDVYHHSRHLVFVLPHSYPAIQSMRSSVIPGLLGRHCTLGRLLCIPHRPTVGIPPLQSWSAGMYREYCLVSSFKV